MQGVGGLAALKAQIPLAVSGSRKTYFTLLPTRGEARYAVEAKGLRAGALVTPFLHKPRALQSVLKTLALDTDVILQRMPIVPCIVFADGGVSQSLALLEVQAQISDVAIVRNLNPEGASLGLLRLMRDGSIL